MLPYLILFALIFSPIVQAEKVIYGEDNRLEFADVMMPALQAKIKSFGAMIPASALSQRQQRVNFVQAKTLEQSIGLCPNELFSQQLKVSECSGFLVAPDIVATAGHCIQTEQDCAKNVWVFGLDLARLEKGQLTASDLYRCREIVRRQSDYVNKIDFALIRLDRAVTGARPLVIRPQHLIPNGEDLMVVGHPSGLPLKVSIDAEVIDHSNPHFIKIAADTFAGSSGSAVLTVPELEVAGILVRGSQDYVFDRFERCWVPRRCQRLSSINGCDGEAVTRADYLLIE